MILRPKSLFPARAAACVLVVLSLSVLFARAYAPASADAPAKAVHGIAVANIDRSVQPGDDFFHYANGEWIKKTVIPPDRAGVGVFTALADLTNKRTAAIIEEAAKQKAAAGSGARQIAGRQIADLYNAYMDEAGIEAKGLTPLKPHLDAIAAIKDKN
ncbi:MAG TPA: M13 family metallopeptidase N-terminal domain-containing protein, partial [Candidatus Limnocylindrales bacterium]|nr:M13 family metallopeptidase N-terminal domain-containing protein [Candidatus Limnocylindrales bacterium]